MHVVVRGGTSGNCCVMYRERPCGRQGEEEFWTFLVPVTLTLTWWPSYMNLTCIAGRYTGCANMNFVRQGFRKLLSDIQTYIHTDRHHKNYRAAALQVVNKLYSIALHFHSFSQFAHAYRMMMQFHAFRAVAVRCREIVLTTRVPACR